MGYSGLAIYVKHIHFLTAEVYKLKLVDQISSFSPGALQQDSVGVVKLQYILCETHMLCLKHT